MKLEVNQYVRVKGYIGKIVNINDCREPDMEIAIEIPCFNDLVFVNRNDITKASHNIIDLIEIGDYVNGCRVIKINLESPLKYVKCINDNCFEEKEIKTILTKKQMENNCYRIDD